MNRLTNLETVLLQPKKKTFLKYNNLESCFETEDKRRFNIINGIPDFFTDDGEKLSVTQSKFYNEIKFPNYDKIDDFGSLLEKSEKSTFFKKLDDEIKMFSKVLEVGWGTGQLSLFLSRYKREIYSVDLSIGSLELGEKFRKLQVDIATKTFGEVCNVEEALAPENCIFTTFYGSKDNFYT